MPTTTTATPQQVTKHEHPDGPCEFQCPTGCPHPGCTGRGPLIGCNFLGGSYQCVHKSSGTALTPSQQERATAAGLKLIAAWAAAHRCNVLLLYADGAEADVPLLRLCPERLPTRSAVRQWLADLDADFGRGPGQDE